MEPLLSLKVEVENFNKFLKKFAYSVNLSTGVILRKFALDAVFRFIQKTPVDTGRARAGWYVAYEGLGGPSYPSPSAEELEGREKGGLTMNLEGQDKWIEVVNGVSYVIYLEYGWSKQAPQGMVRVSLRELAGTSIKKVITDDIQYQWKNS